MGAVAVHQRVEFVASKPSADEQDGDGKPHQGKNRVDHEGDADAVGKATGKDDACGKATLVKLLGIDDARASLEKGEREAVEALHPFGGRAATLIEAARFAALRTR